MISEFRGEFSFLSNFYPCGVELDNLVFPTVEHAFQAAKTTNMDDRLFISMLDTPGQAKRAGRKVTLRPGWDDIKIHVMRYLLHQKFAQEPFHSLLLATGEQHIEEGNAWGDRFWGVSPVGSGNGQNMLGRLLMQVRREIE